MDTSSLDAFDGDTSTHGDPQTVIVGEPSDLQRTSFDSTTAPGINASHSNFTTVRGNQYITSMNHAEGPDKLVLAVLKPVDHTGYYVLPCMEGTRRSIFEEVDQWLDDFDEPNILWLHGSPGSGKSTVASSLVSRYRDADRGRLVSSFAFKRGDVMLSDPTAVWRTVAHDLARYDDTFARDLVRVLKGPSIDPGRPDIASHFKHLIKGPLTRSFGHITPIIIIDALDECGSNNSRAGQRNIFIDTVTQWSSLPRRFKLIVTGRNERVPDTFRRVCKQLLLPTGDEVNQNANQDIRHFFETRFAKFEDCLDPELLRRRGVFDTLTGKAAGLFIWAETVVRFMEQGVHEERLGRVLDGDMGGGADITKLYRQVLEFAFQETDSYTLKAFNQVVSTIVLAKVPLHEDDLPHFIPQTRSSIKSILNRLSSVISIGSDKRLRISHLSFSEFLCDSDRCPIEFYIGRGEGSQKFSMACFRLMQDRLRFNICDLETSHLMNDQVVDLSQRIQANIGSPLLYSCRFWAAHLQDSITNQCVNVDLMTTEVQQFLYVRFLFWLEVMSLTDEIAAANIALLTIAPLIEPQLSDFIRDGSRFVVNFYIPISESAPHIYLSALPFAPSESLIRKRYKSIFPNTLSVLCGHDQKWPACVNIFRGHTDAVCSVAFSVDGARVASGSLDKTICIWDAQTGQVIAGPFEGHTDYVHSVAFSVDGTQVASGSRDKTIRVWDAQIGHVIAGPFEGHTDSVRSVAFSADGTRVVSGSNDGTVRIWDAQTGQVIAGPFHGHTNSIRSVAFSADGARVASGSRDKTICIWDAQTGQVIAGPFEDDTKSVSSFAFSADGTRVASGSWDKTIRIWDTQTGQVIAGPFTGLTDFVHSVAFSADGTRVVSGSNDETIRIWDAQTGRVIAGPFEGHTDSINSLAFSADGTRVASGSRDKTIRIWDAQAGQAIASSFEGHTSSVHSVAFSADGTRVASGSLDKTIRIWDARTGQVIAGPFKGHTNAVYCVAFSANGAYIASGSRDRTIRIWDAQTCRVIAGPFEGHTDSVNSVAFSADGTRVASGSNDKTIRIWDVQTGQVIAGPFEGHTDYVYSVAFSADGTRVASGSLDRTIRVWDAQTGQVIAGPLEGHTDSVDSIAFSADGTQVSSGSWDKTIRIWDAQTGQAIAGPFIGHTNSVESVAFSADGMRVASGSWDKTVRIWDAQTGQVIAGPYAGHTNSVHSVAFSADGVRVASGSSDNTIRIWDVLMDTPDSHISIRGACNCFRPSYFELATGLRQIVSRGWLCFPYIVSKEDAKIYFWVPPTCREGLCSMETLCILGRRTTRLDLSRFVHGTSWTQCYVHTPPPPSSSLVENITNTPSQTEYLKFPYLPHLQMVQGLHRFPGMSVIGSSMCLQMNFTPFFQEWRHCMYAG